MAGNNITKPDRKVSKQLDSLNNSMKHLYQDIYSSRSSSKNDMNNIVSKIDDNVDDILSTVNNTSVSDLSNLYMRLQNKSGSNSKTQEELRKATDELFSNQNILNSINMNNIQRYIQGEDYQYDLICKYMPKLEDALEIKKDNVLSSDNFTKDFINIISSKSNEDANKMFIDKANALKEKYKIQDLYDEIYDDASHYGEYFLYHVPYKTALKRLLDRKTSGANYIRQESVDMGNSDLEKITLLSEASFVDPESTNDLAKKISSSMQDYLKSEKSSVNLYFDKNAMLPEVISYVSEQEKARSIVKGLNESYSESAGSEKNTGSEEKFTGNDKLQYKKLDIAPDGFVNTNGKDITIKEIDGSVMHKIKRSDILPVYIGDYCVGYYHFNIANDSVNTSVMTGGFYNSLINNNKMKDDEFEQQNDLLVNSIASDISNQIDAKFINNNIDLKEEIYAILRYNDRFNASRGTNNIIVTFLPVEDVQHFYFKLDPVTHRGISDLKKSVVPAMLYCLLYLTNIIGQISRSQDKRIYYVKQNIETNVARTMLNVIQQLKKGNMGMRQLENMNSIFNVIGKYNDHIIPMGQNGEAPIQFEVMQGQQIDTPSELMERMEESAINSTDVPLEFVQSVNNVDFATRFTMSNSKFLRKVFKRQRICQDFFSKVFTRLYNYEYRENEKLIQIQLPAPSFLTMTNSQQLVENTKNFINSIADIELANEDDDVRSLFVKTMCRNYLGSYVNYDLIDSTINKCKQLVAYEKTNKTDDDYEDSSDEY